MHAWFFEGQLGDFFVKIFGHDGIPAYGVMMCLAIIASATFFVLMYKRFGFSLSQVMWLLIYMVIFGLLGAHVFSLLFRIHELDFTSWDAFKITFSSLIGSLMYYGGFIGGLIGLIVYNKKEGVPFGLAADFTVMILPIAHGLGRIGCFLAGCCYGRETDSCIGVHFEHGAAQYLDKVIPTQLFEVGFNLILFAIFMILFFAFYRKGISKTESEKGTTVRSKYQGLNIIIYMLAYPVYRFVIEFFRADNRGAIFSLSTSQFISILVFGMGIYLLVKYIQRFKNGTLAAELFVPYQVPSEKDTSNDTASVTDEGITVNPSVTTEADGSVESDTTGETDKADSDDDATK